MKEEVRRLCANETTKLRHVQVHLVLARRRQSVLVSSMRSFGWKCLNPLGCAVSSAFQEPRVIQKVTGDPRQSCAVRTAEQNDGAWRKKTKDKKESKDKNEIKKKRNKEGQKKKKNVGDPKK
jgi:hypothetical protein